MKPRPSAAAHQRRIGLLWLSPFLILLLAALLVMAADYWRW
jgi:hypothetical protein